MPKYGPTMGFGGLHKFRVAKHRVEFLADGVFAIVMTLLVLELKVPELPRHVNASGLLHELLQLGPVFFAFFITFLLSGSYWFLHNLSMEFVKHADQKLSFINLGFLFFVALFPFSTALLGHFLGNPAAQATYFLNQFGAASFLMLNWRYARAASLLAPVEPEMERRLSTQLRGLAMGALAAALCATVAPHQSFLVMIFVLLGNRAVARWRAPKPAPSQAAAETVGLDAGG